MSSKPRTRLLRPLILIGLMGGLCAMLYWQRLHIGNARQKQGLPPAGFSLRDDGRPPKDDTTVTLDGLLATAEKAELKIRALRKERAEASRLPYLLVPVLQQPQTRETLEAEYLEFRLRELDAYRRLTQDTGAAKAAGEVFLDAYLRPMSDWDDPLIDFGALSKLGQAALSAGSRDPALRTHLAFCDWKATANATTAIAEWEAVLKELPQTSYPKILQSYAAVYLVDADRTMSKLRSHRSLAVAKVTEWLEEEAESPRWFRSVNERFARLIQYSLSSERHELATACARSKMIDPYLCHTLLGWHYINMAWSKRGSGWAIDVKPEQWDGFHAAIRKASSHLQYAWSLHPELPQAPMQMITIAMAGEDTERPYYWWLRTIEAQYDYAPAYQHLAHALTSRWSGDREDLLQFGHNCAETLRFDTLVPYQALAVLKMVKTMELPEGKTLADDPAAMKLLRRFLYLRQGFRDDPQRPPMFEDGGRYRAELLVLLEDAGLHEQAATMLRETEGRLYWGNVRHRNRPGRFLAARRLALQSPLGDRVATFDERLQQRRIPPADPQVFAELEAERQALQDEYRAWEKPIDGLPDYFAHAQIMIEQERVFHTSAWVPLPLTGYLPGWEPYADRWRLAEDGSVSVYSQDATMLQVTLRPLASFPLPCEVEADVEILGPGPDFLEAGIGWSREGIDTENLHQGGHPLFRVHPVIDNFRDRQQKLRRDLASIAWSKGFFSSNRPLSDVTTHRLCVKLWKNYVEYQVGDAWFAMPSPNELHADGWLCFGESFPRIPRDLSSDGGVRFNNIRVRRLVMPSPPTISSERHERMDYWAQRLADEPDDLVSQIAWTGVLIDQGRYQEALDQITSLIARRPLAQGLHQWRARALTGLCRYAEALAEFKASREDWYDDSHALWRHADLLATVPDATLRNGQRALDTINMCMRSIKGPAPRGVYEAMAAAQAELGRFEEAVESQMKAMNADSDVADVISTMRLESYRSHTPWRLQQPRTVP